MRTSLSLPLRLVILVAGTTLPLIIFAAAIVSLNYQAARSEAAARILEVTRSMMLVVDRELHSTIAALRVLALSIALQRDDLAAFRQQAASFLRDYPEGANLPVHLESRPLVADGSAPGTVYAGFALMPYAELWRTALEGGNLLSRIDPISLAGGLAFLLLLILLGVIGTRWLLYRANRTDLRPTKL